jgi:hypothetical protein
MLEKLFTSQIPLQKGLVTKGEQPFHIWELKSLLVDLIFVAVFSFALS